jgi:hypothetical protein
MDLEDSLLKVITKPFFADALSQAVDEFAVGVVGALPLGAWIFFAAPIGGEDETTSAFRATGGPEAICRGASAHLRDIYASCTAQDVAQVCRNRFLDESIPALLCPAIVCAGAGLLKDLIRHFRTVFWHGKRAFPVADHIAFALLLFFEFVCLPCDE